MKRYGSVIGLKEADIPEYKRLHADVWPGVLAQIKNSNITNYSIFLRQPENLLFAYYEYVGTDFAADMARMAADPITKDWWKVCTPMQQRLSTGKDSEWWIEMEEVFHTD